MIFPKFTSSVGVAPGTTTMQLGRSRYEDPRGCCDGGNVPDDCCNQRSTFALGAALPFVERQNHYPIDPFTQWQGRLPLGALPQTRIRWDIVGIIGGGSLIIAMAIGLVASALSK